MYDEEEAIAHIEALSIEGKMHISHTVRNGLQNILSSYCLGGDVEKEINKVSSELEKIGL